MARKAPNQRQTWHFRNMSIYLTTSKKEPTLRNVTRATWPLAQEFPVGPLNTWSRRGTGMQSDLEPSLMYVVTSRKF